MEKNNEGETNVTAEEQELFAAEVNTNAALHQSVEQLTLQNKQQSDVIFAQSEQLSMQTRLLEYQGELLKRQSEQIEELLHKIDELTKKGKDSHNSSKPPSSDGYGKKPAPKSLKKSSGKRQGGQPGHKGSGMKIDREPDKVVEHYPSICEQCPNRGKCTSHVCESRYVIDIEVKTTLTQHKQMECKCRLQKNELISGTFPADVPATKQYGGNITALASVLSTVGMVSIERIHQILQSFSDLDISTGTIQNMLRRLNRSCKAATKKIYQKVINLPLIHCDETGLRVEGSLHWLHCACNSGWSYYFLHKKRGTEAIEEMAVLPGYQGVMVHDCWSPYFKINTAEHALCGAHIARELVYAHENLEQAWAGELKELLFEILGERYRLKAAGAACFSQESLQKFDAVYTDIVSKGFEQNPPPEITAGKRGRQARGKVLALLDRLQKYKAEILRFAYDWAVPFTNNEAERTIRFSKVRQKVSGCFRSKACAIEYADTMSYINTAKKHGISFFKAVRQALQGRAEELVMSWG